MGQRRKLVDLAMRRTYFARRRAIVSAPAGMAIDVGWFCRREGRRFRARKPDEFVDLLQIIPERLVSNPQDWVRTRAFGPAMEMIFQPERIVGRTQEIGQRVVVADALVRALEMLAVRAREPHEARMGVIGFDRRGRREIAAQEAGDRVRRIAYR